jgi:hypothetical protein
MTAGNNRAFKSEKSAFLHDNPLTVGFLLEDMPDQSGIYDFDIQPRGMAAGNVLEIVGFGRRTKQPTADSTRIRAFWLPWQSKQAVFCDLDDTADYFFTSEMNGCQFRVARTGANTLRAIHVAGDSPSSAIQVGSQWRNTQAENLLTAPQRLLSRRLTSSAPLGATVPGAQGVASPGSMVGYDGPHSWQNVFGFRRTHLFGGATWQFWYQTVAPAPPPATGYVATAALLCHI